jgi:hypothetical protein
MLMQQISSCWKRKPIRHANAFLAEPASPWRRPASNYEPLRSDKDSLAWEIRGQGMKRLTEQEMMTAGGGRKVIERSSPVSLPTVYLRCLIQS